MQQCFRTHEARGLDGRVKVETVAKGVDCGALELSHEYFLRAQVYWRMAEGQSVRDAFRLVGKVAR